MYRPDAVIARFAALALLSSTPCGAGADPGAVLFNSLGCANCHAGEPAGAPRRIGPDLTDLPSRVDHGWLLEFLENPENERMPAMFGTLPEADRAGAIVDVAGWLGTLGDGLKFKPERHANAERGSALYHEIGCVACHAASSEHHPARPGSIARADAVPFPDLRRKTSLLALADFLRNTHRYRPDARMPQFPLAPDEAIDIAAHLLDFQGSDPGAEPPLKSWPKADTEAIRRGRQWVEKLDCAACHVLPGVTNARKTKPIRDSAAGCLADQGPARYVLTTPQKESLAGYLARPHGSQLDRNRAESGMEEADAVLGALRCDACHSRNGKGGPSPATRPYFVGDEALGDAGIIPPPLTGIGGKLNEKWIKELLAGKSGPRVRPYLRTRMPVYPTEHAEALANALMSADLRDDHGPPPQGIEMVDDLESGRRLLGTQGGVNCITCHLWSERPSLGIRALDISDLDKRLRPEWFREYLLDPAAYRPGTLMPSLWLDGHSSVTDILGGDTEKQIGAIWAYIRDGKGDPDGFPDNTAGPFELIPTNRPIIQRAFLAGVGTHAILVGFPGGINLAYDAATAEPKLLWRGRFFDAYHTWFSRSAPFEKPLEDTLLRFMPASRGARFAGYELDTAGNPTFLSRIGEATITEHFEAKDGELVHVLRSKGLESLSYSNPDGTKLRHHTSDTKGDIITEEFIYSFP